MSATEAPNFPPLEGPAVPAESLGMRGTLAHFLKSRLRSTIGRNAFEALARMRPRRSETSRYRAILAPHCRGAGVDIGFGGDAITPAAIRMDLPAPYTRLGPAPVQLGGDCRALTWLRDGGLDYVYSSHVLEDFPEAETAAILQEWVRLLKPGGRMVLLLPDQQRYLAHCRRVGEVDADGAVGNAHHAIAHFSLDYVESVARRLGTLRRVAAHPSLGPYSFAVVYEKMT